MQYPIKVNFKASSNLFEIRRWFKELEDYACIACDFETASKYTQKEKDNFKKQLEIETNKNKIRLLRQAILSNGLSHPSLAIVTHLNIAWSNKNAYVIIADTPIIRKEIFKFLTNFMGIQLWHNAVFDFKHIYYNTYTLPHDYLDTQLLAKCLLNNANSALDKTKLKELMANEYGEWTIAKDDFTLENLHNPKLLEYAAIDACATYSLYYDKILKAMNE